MLLETEKLTGSWTGETIHVIKQGSLQRGLHKAFDYNIMFQSRIPNVDWFWTKHLCNGVELLSTYVNIQVHIRNAITTCNCVILDDVGSFLKHYFFRH